MAYRVTEAEVREIINTSVATLTAFIIPANQLVTQHLGGLGMSDEVLKEVERWLSAHFIAIREPRVREQSMGDAKEKFALSGGYAGGLDATPYGQQAMVIDYTGTLAGIVGKRAVILDAVEEDYT